MTAVLCTTLCQCCMAFSSNTSVFLERCYTHTLGARPQKQGHYRSHTYMAYYSCRLHAWAVVVSDLQQRAGLVLNCFPAFFLHGMHPAL